MSNNAVRMEAPARHFASLVWVSTLLMGLALLLLPAPTRAQAQQEREGVVLYWGLVPAALVAERHAPDALHGQPSPVGAETHHLVVALFDKASGKRIEDAVVRARLREIGIADAPPKYLIPMQVNGAASYGQVFSTAKPGPYRFELLVKLPGRANEVEFSISANSPHPQAR